MSLPYLVDPNEVIVRGARGQQSIPRHSKGQLKKRQRRGNGISGICKQPARRLEGQKKSEALPGNVREAVLPVPKEPRDSLTVLPRIPPSYAI